MKQNQGQTLGETPYTHQNDVMQLGQYVIHLLIQEPVEFLLLHLQRLFNAMDGVTKYIPMRQPRRFPRRSFCF